MNVAIGQHHMQVAHWCYRLADALALPNDERFDILIAGLLYDIGAFSMKDRLDRLAFEGTGPGEHAIAGSLILERFEPFRRLAEKNIPGCAGFSFVFKAGFFTHSGAMCGKAQRRRRIKRQAGGYIL
ncbi:hypothetical protein DSCO28_66830 [Desulfosarcina ovata subsp. sediminis]|uniref:HD domain-containing protein n=1 Tax=Desulfosarcina ovata subsp. sediminis TaxID=885957 RepID=A0A5K8A0X4_9BACT|nr:hypothetical protein DSCO28_66830 [Desulfosarcina ovata subsp. sediminis]